MHLKRIGSDCCGVGDQAAWVVDAFASLGGIDAALDAEHRRLVSG